MLSLNSPFLTYLNRNQSSVCIFMNFLLLFFSTFLLGTFHQWHVKHVLKSFYEKVSETLMRGNAGKGFIIVCAICVLISKKQLLSNLKILMKFSSLLKWIMLQKIFYLLVLLKLHIWEYWQMKIGFAAQPQCILSRVQTQH